MSFRQDVQLTRYFENELFTWHKSAHHYYILSLIIVLPFAKPAQSTWSPADWLKYAFPLGITMTASEIEFTKLIIAILALGGTAIAAVIAIKTFWRTEQWKRAEFLAKEMKEFFSDRRVQNTLLLIDWGTRRIALLNDEPAGMTLVTRNLQAHALLPHTLINENNGSDSEMISKSDESNLNSFTPEEVAIRDCYDAFLFGLERLASYVSTNLVSAEELRPYLGYWIDDIHAPTEYPEDAAWVATLLTYIDFYRFRGTQSLFRAFNRDISCSSSAYLGFLEKMEDQTLAQRLAKVSGLNYLPESSA